MKRSDCRVELELTFAYVLCCVALLNAGLVPEPQGQVEEEGEDDWLRVADVQRLAPPRPSLE